MTKSFGGDDSIIVNFAIIKPIYKLCINGIPDEGTIYYIGTRFDSFKEIKNIICTKYNTEYGVYKKAASNNKIKDISLIKCGFNSDNTITNINYYDIDEEHGDDRDDATVSMTTTERDLC